MNIKVCHMKYAGCRWCESEAKLRKVMEAYAAFPSIYYETSSRIIAYTMHIETAQPTPHTVNLLRVTNALSIFKFRVFISLYGCQLSNFIPISKLNFEPVFNVRIHIAFLYSLKFVGTKYPKLSALRSYVYFGFCAFQCSLHLTSIFQCLHFILN